MLLMIGRHHSNLANEILSTQISEVPHPQYGSIGTQISDTPFRSIRRKEFSHVSVTEA